MSSTDSPASYSELVGILEMLPALVREKRRRNGLTYRDTASATGLADSIVHRFEHGKDVRLATAITLLRWVGAP